MLSWFSRTSKSSKTTPSHSDGSEQQEPQTVIAPSTVPEEEPSSQDPAQRTQAPPAAIGASPVAAASVSEQPRKSTFTAALNTPHDAILAELQGHHSGHDPSARADSTPSTSALGMQSIDTLPAPASDVPGSIATTSSPPPESLYDPFTGVMMGVLSPTSSAAKQSSEDLWAHMSRIRSLQAEVARLHVTMEGIGLGESAVTHPGSPTPRAVGERLEDDENSEADGGYEAEKQRAREFERSERRFDGRKEEIGQIMSKLGELSQALAAFHAHDTPMFHSTAATPRSPTVSTTPMPRNPTLRHPDLHHIYLEVPSRGREEAFDSPASIQEPLPIFEDLESKAEPAQLDSSVP